MYSQYDEIGVLEVLEIFFATLFRRRSHNFLKILSMVFEIHWYNLYEFLKNKKSKRNLNFFFYHYQYSQHLPEEIVNCKTSKIPYKGVCKLDNLFQIVSH